MKNRKVHNHSSVRNLIALGCVVAINGVVPHCTAEDWRQVNENVRDQISMLQPSIGSHNIEIDNRGRGDIALEGYVESEDARRRVQQAAEKAEGVTEVENRLRVSRTGEEPQDPEIAKLQEALRREVPHGKYNIAVNIHPNKAVLHGTADSPATKSKVLEVASSVSKRSIVDEITVLPAMTDMEIQESIQRALNKEYPSLMKGLDITVMEGVAKVEGNVSRTTDVDKILATILNVEGVRDIESQVKVRGHDYTQE
jgi:osmotically-inducible protein OsmY